LPKCLYAGTLTLPPETVSELAADGIELVVNPYGRAPTEDELIALLPDFDAVLAGPEPYTANVVASSKRLKIIARTGVGYDKVDIAAATRNHVFVTWTPVPELASSVADQAIALMLALVKRTAQMNEEVRAGRWERQRWSTEVGDLRGHTLGLLGLGRIGSEVAVRATAFGMKVIYYDVIRMEQREKELPIRYVPVERLLAESDVISIHAPLTPETRNLINEASLRLMKPSAILVNTSRGEIVNEKALAEALETNRLAGAGLDVLTKEPPTEGHVFYRLGDRIPNLILTGHVAFGADTFRAMMKAACNDVRRALKGELPKYLLNPEAVAGTTGR
jgi:D-3-phosphoglycerate dehydrogenase